MQSLLLALHSYFISPVLTILFFAILVFVILSWLFVADVIPRHNQTAQSIYRFLDSIISPLARPIRRYVPPLGRLDLSVILLVLGILFLRDFFIVWLIRFIPF